MFQKLKGELYEIMEVPAYENGRGWFYEIFMMALILANGITIILGTVGWIQQQYDWFLTPFETISVLIFSVEYLILLWVCTDNKKYGQPILGRLKYAATPIAIINLVSVLPAFIPLIFPIDLRALRLIRLFRIIRLFKLTKYSDSLQVLTKAVESKKEQLLMTSLIVVFIVVMASIFMFFAEFGENPATAFSDIPNTIWWSFVTLSPISSEPGIPVTFGGKAIASFLAILEIGIFAIPAGIMASAFDEQWKADRDERERQLKECRVELHEYKVGNCPHCNRPFDEVDRTRK